MDDEVREVGPWNKEITTEEYQQAWKQANERTSAGPSGLTFAMFKVIARNTNLAKIGAALASIPFSTGITPTRWCKGTEVMIEKKKGNFRVDKLRTILLFEADFNMNNKIMARRTMAHAEKHDQLAPEQYGSRKGQRANLLALNK